MYALDGSDDAWIARFTTLQVFSYQETEGSFLSGWGNALWVYHTG